MRDLVVTQESLKLAPVTNLLVEELIQIEATHLCFFTDPQPKTRRKPEDEQENASNYKAVGTDRRDFCRRVRYMMSTTSP